MLRMRVYRLSLPITLLGVELWAFGVIGGGAVISLQFYSSLLPSILPFPAAATTGFFLYRIVYAIKRFFPGRAFYHLMIWLTQGDRYAILRETRCMPLIVPDEVAPQEATMTLSSRHRPAFEPLVRFSKE
jgi:hypothetical protein